MHPCLGIAEVQNEIFEYCSEEQTTMLAHLSVVCRAFYDTALDILWRELDDVSPLIKCIPSDGMWKETVERHEDGTEVKTLVSLPPLPTHPVHAYALRIS